MLPLRVCEWGGKHDKHSRAFYAYVHHNVLQTRAAHYRITAKSQAANASPFLNEESTLIKRGVKSRHINVSNVGRIFSRMVCK